MNTQPYNSHDPPVLLFALASAFLSALLWLLLRMKL